jgi:hypothetical protein
LESHGPIGGRGASESDILRQRRAPLAFEGDHSTATAAYGSGNTALVVVDDRRATAGPGNDNTATVTGDGLVADTDPGDGYPVVVP